MNVADILDKAADLIEPEGAWVQEEFIRVTGAGGPVLCCAVGALALVLSDKHPYADRIGEAEAWVNEHRALLGMSAADLESWNDDEERQQEEVVALFREAASKARAEARP